MILEMCWMIVGEIFLSYRSFIRNWNLNLKHSSELANLLKVTYVWRIFLQAAENVSA